MSWSVYVLQSETLERTYVGITTEVERRLEQHNGDLPGGAKSTRQGRPWILGTTFGPFETRSEASRIEYEVKQLRGRERLSYEPSSTLEEDPG